MWNEVLRRLGLPSNEEGTVNIPGAGTATRQKRKFVTRGSLRARITGFSEDNLSFLCKLIDKSDAAVGSEFTAYARVIPYGLVLQICTPTYAVGDDIRIVYQRNKLDETLTEGWWVDHIFTQSSLVLVKVRKTAGVAGDEDTACSWVYSIWTLDLDPASDTATATELAPTYPRRTSVGEYDYAVDDSIGVASYSVADEEWTLLLVAERPTVEACS
jgi:hypothetical protein